MTANIDIFRSAKLLVDKHGLNAVLEAAQRADALLEKGDLDGQAVWLRILDAVRQLLAEPGGQTVH